MTGHEYHFLACLPISAFGESGPHELERQSRKDPSELTLVLLGVIILI